MSAFFVWAAKLSGLRSSVSEIYGHSGQMPCNVDKRVVKLLTVLAPEYPHFWK